MCLCAKHFLFAFVQVVPGRCPPARHGPVRRAGTGRNETLLRVRGRVHAEVQPGEVLPGLRETAAPPQGGTTAAEKIPAVYAFRALKIPKNQGDSEAVGGVAE